jgi:hypothetical protein
MGSVWADALRRGARLDELATGCRRLRRRLPGRVERQEDAWRILDGCGGSMRVAAGAHLDDRACLATAAALVRPRCRFGFSIWGGSGGGGGGDDDDDDDVTGSGGSSSFEDQAAEVLERRHEGRAHGRPRRRQDRGAVGANAVAEGGEAGGDAAAESGDVGLGAVWLSCC